MFRQAQHECFPRRRQAEMQSTHYERKAAFDSVAAEMEQAFSASSTRHGKRLVQVTTALRGWAGNMFDFFHDGFESGRLQESATFPPDYVCEEILDLAQNDLSIMNRVAYQYSFLPKSATDALGKAETLAQLAMQPAYEAGWLDPVWMMCFFDDDIAIRSTPYAPVGMVSIPFIATRYPFDTVVLPHEVAHFLWDYAEIATGGIDDTVPGALEGLPPFVQSWANETFCDAYASAVAGAAPALWFWQKMEAVPDVRANRMGPFSYSADNGKHIPHSLRPLVFAKILSALGRPLAQELYEQWVGTAQKRGLPPVNTVIDGQMVDIPVQELIDFSLAINPEYPMDRLIATLLPLVARLKPNVLLRHGDGAKDLDELAANFVKDAERGFGEPVPNYDSFPLRVKTWSTLTKAWLPGVDVEKDNLSEEQWMRLFESGGWTKQRQHTLKGEPMQNNMVWHPQQGWIQYPAVGMQPPAVGMQPPAVGMQPPAAGMQPPVIGMHPPAAGMQPPVIGMHPPAAGMYPASYWQRMSEDGSPQASISLNSPWRLFLETDVAPGTDWIPYLPKPGKFQHGKYGEVNISSERNANFVQNFNAGIYQTQLPVDAEHNTKESGALGWLGRMRMNADGSADAQVTWNVRGQQMLSEKRFKYVSPEFYDKWTDPATGKQYNDVAIGVALTTRPFFKESHLRPLIATERGIFTPEFQQAAQPQYAAPQVSSYRYAGGRRMEESPTEGGQANPQAVAELQQRFAEIEAAHNESVAHSLRLTEALDRSNAVIAQMQGAAQTRRFTDLVDGDKRWYGPLDTHLKVLLSFAETFGENSDEFQTYVQQQQALAEQLHTSEVFKEYGHSRQGAKRSAADELEVKARQLQSEQAGLSYAQAYSEVVSSNPALYDRYERGE